jgi:hypothetical protein
MRQNTGMSDCPELAKLQRQYQLALKVWGEQEFAVYNAPVATEATRIALVQNKQHFLKSRHQHNPFPCRSILNLEGIPDSFWNMDNDDPCTADSIEEGCSNGECR